MNTVLSTPTSHEFLFRKCHPSHAMAAAAALQLKLLNFDITGAIGKGTYGVVYKAKFLGSECAIKIIHTSPLSLLVDQISLRRFEQECQFMNTLKHKNLVQSMGTVTLDYPVLVMELMECNLNTYLENNQSMAFQMEVSIADDIINGIRFLHHNKIVHRDLSGANILMAGSRAKISDLGMAKLLSAFQPNQLTPSPGTRVYMPFNAFLENPSYNEKIDIYSYGVLLIQIMTKKYPTPFEHYKEENGCKIYQSEIERRQHHIIEIPDSHPLKQIALGCLHDDQDKRPSAVDIQENMEVIKNSDFYISEALKYEQKMQIVRQCDVLQVYQENQALLAARELNERHIQQLQVRVGQLDLGVQQMQQMEQSRSDQLTQEKALMEQKMEADRRTMHEDFQKQLEDFVKLFRQEALEKIQENESKCLLAVQQAQRDVLIAQEKEAKATKVAEEKDLLAQPLEKKLGEDRRTMHEEFQKQLEESVKLFRQEALEKIQENESKCLRVVEQAQRDVLIAQEKEAKATKVAEEKGLLAQPLEKKLGEDRKTMHEEFQKQLDKFVKLFRQEALEKIQENESKCLLAVEQAQRDALIAQEKEAKATKVAEEKDILVQQLEESYCTQISQLVERSNSFSSSVSISLSETHLSVSRNSTNSELLFYTDTCPALTKLHKDSAAVVHNETIYVRPARTRDIHKYFCGQWSFYLECKVDNCTLAIVLDSLITIGGRRIDRNTELDVVSNLYRTAGTREWIDDFLPMPTARESTLAITSGKTLIVVGGRDKRGNVITVVEVFHEDSQQWQIACSLPFPLNFASITTFDESLIIHGMEQRSSKEPVSLSCKLTDLICSCAGGKNTTNIWIDHELKIPLKSSLVKFNNRLLAVGGQTSDGEATGTVFSYSLEVENWIDITSLSKPRYLCFTAVMSDTLYIIGGDEGANTLTDSVEIGIYQ